MRRVLALTVVGLVVAIFLPATAGAETAPTLSVSPSTDLVAGQEVTVSGVGFAPDTSIAFCQGRLTPTPAITDCGTAYQTAATDGSGAFSSTFVVVRYMQFGSTVIDCAQPGAPCGFGATPLFNPGAIVTTPIEFRIQPPGDPDTAFTGTILDAAGEPVEGAVVWGFAPGDQWVGSIRTTTGPDGRYRLEDPVLGVDYHVAFGSPPGAGLNFAWYASFDLAGRTVPNRFPIGMLGIQAATLRATFVAPEVEAEVVTLHPAAILSGRVLDPIGEPVVGAVVRGYLENDGIYGTYAAVTGSDGSFRIDWLWAHTLGSGQARVVIVAPTGSGLATEWYDDAASRATGDWVQFTQAEETTIEVILAPAMVVLRF